MKEELMMGGQAVIEGVLMKGKNSYSVAVRLPNGKIKLKKERLKSLTVQHKFFNSVFIRGVIILFEMLIMGYKALTWSADQQEDGEDEKLSAWHIALTTIISILITVVIFVFVPFYLAKIVFSPPSIAFNILDGIFRLGIFIAYVGFISLFKDVRRLFQYHGAEHMAVHCYEAKLPLTVKNVRKFSTIHPRCGTSFIMYVLIVSIIVFSFIKFELWYVNLPIRIIALPVIAGISYELLRISSGLGRAFGWLSLPGRLVQKITTQKPNDAQIE